MIVSSMLPVLLVKYAAALLVSELFRRRSSQRGNSVIDVSLREPALVERA